MALLYVIATGRMLDAAGELVGIGYAGNGQGLNNPEAVRMVGVGPLPPGEYTIGPPHTPVDHLGPLALPLWPSRSNAMFGRSGFFIHGDNPAANHTASNGCIILGPQFRRAIVASGEGLLDVVLSEAETSAAQKQRAGFD